jgi:phage-related protein
MNYTFTYYSAEVQADIMALPKTLQSRYISLSARMMVHGANLGEPHTKSLGDGLFELRLKGSEGIARVFYCTLVGRRIVMLHSFVKKTQKTPVHEMKIAQNRMNEVKHEH